MSFCERSEGSISRAYTDSYCDFPCDPCHKKGNPKPATKYCEKCKLFYCRRCIGRHNKRHAHHPLKNPIDFPFIGQDTDIWGTCIMHKKKSLDSFCKAHDEIVCCDCIALEHGSCSEIQPISDVIEDLGTNINTNISEIIEKLTLSKKKMDEIKKNKHNILVELQKSRNQAISKVKSFRNELENELRRLERASIAQIEAQYDIDENSVRTQLQDAENHEEKLEQAFKQLGEGEVVKIEKFVRIKSAEKILRSSEQANRRLSDVHLQQDDFGYVLNANIGTTLKELKSLGLKEGETHQVSFDEENLKNNNRLKQNNTKIIVSTSPRNRNNKNRITSRSPTQRNKPKLPCWIKHSPYYSKKFKLRLW